MYYLICMPKGYIEIIHTSQNELEGFKKKDPARLGRIVDRIFTLEETIKTTYVMGKLNSDIPRSLPKGTRIRVGGAYWRLCVKDRVDYLKKAGYKNAYADRSISFSYEDLDEAGLINSF